MSRTKLKLKASKKNDKKKSKKSKDEWSHEGGMIRDGNDAAKVKQKLHKTQEFDEKIRRGKFKMNENEMRQKSIKKMSHKVKFSTIIQQYALQQENQSNSIDKSTTIVKKSLDDTMMKRLSLPAIPNDPREILSKLQEMLPHKTLVNEHNSLKLKSKSNNAANSSSRKFQIDSHDLIHISEGNIHSMTLVDDVVVDDLDQEIEIIQQTEDDDDDDDIIRNHSSQSSYQLAFNSDYITKNSNVSTPLQKLSLFDLPDYDLYGHLTEPQLINKITSLSSIPGLSKVWKFLPAEKKKDLLRLNNTLESSLMTYLTTYSDLFIEYKDFVDLKPNSSNILKCILFHAVTHTVRSRLVIPV